MDAVSVVGSFSYFFFKTLSPHCRCHGSQRMHHISCGFSLPSSFPLVTPPSQHLPLLSCSRHMSMHIHCRLQVPQECEGLLLILILRPQQQHTC